MLKNARFVAQLPAKDLRRAKAFYGQQLGLTAKQEDAGGIMYESRDGSRFNVFASSGAPSGDHTQIAFEVSDLAGEVKDLKGRGIKFEEYDQPGFKTVNGIAEVGPYRGAWFKDTEGNLIAVVQQVTVPAAR